MRNKVLIEIISLSLPSLRRYGRILAERGGDIMTDTQRNTIHDLAVAVAHAYISDETKRGEYRESGVEGAAKDAWNVYLRAYKSIANAK